MDVTCRYWPYLNKVAEGLPELLPLTEMRPFLSVLHAKAHTAKCEVRWGGRSQDGAGNTVGEEVEQVNSFLSRAALVTKYMTKAGRVNMLTRQAMGWNRRKRDNLYNIKHSLSTIPFLSPTKGNTFRLKRSIFDQVMLLKRLEEEQSILVKEMSQHIKYLLKQVQEVESLRGQTLEGIKTCSFVDLTEVNETTGFNWLLNT
ncbi:uncharacterized protein LOC143736107 isoform X1 [Siphateles boraxobius]|uniref:uncharacterized protein LOC143736107 isoform X1 n=1 Tax=Siphateles boraxobius TaxID=180520 RepID=UPI004062858C